MANFFGWIEVGYTFTAHTVFTEVLQAVKDQFKQELVKEKIAMHMNGYVRLEKNPLVRADVFLFLWRCDDAWLHFEDPG